MASTLLYHGPSARDSALNAASDKGRLVCPPLGDDGLKVDDARMAVDLLLSTPMGLEVGVLVIGPMDLANPKASDTLLKSLEEFSDLVQPILWAKDLGGVSPTIRSRCLAHWCPVVPGQAEMDEDEVIEGLGRSAINAALSGNWGQLPDIDQMKGKEWALLHVMSEALKGRLAEPQGAEMWEALRLVAMRTNPSPIELLGALLSGVSQ